MPLVDLDDPEELRARWSALAAVAHATGFDRRWYADADGWYHQDETGSDLRMVRLSGGRSVLFGYHTQYSRTGGTDLLAGAPDWIGQPEVKRRIAAGTLGFVYGSFNGTWARASYEGDPWQPVDDGFAPIGQWITSDEESARELIEWAAEWADYLGGLDELVPLGVGLIRSAAESRLSAEELDGFFARLGIGPRSPQQPDLYAALAAAAQFDQVVGAEAAEPVAAPYVAQPYAGEPYAGEVVGEERFGEGSEEEEEEELFIVPPGVSPFTNQPITDDADPIIGAETPHDPRPPYAERPAYEPEPAYQDPPAYEPASAYEPPAPAPEPPPADYGVVSKKPRLFGRKKKQREEENASLAGLGLVASDPEPAPSAYDRPLPSSEPPRVGAPVEDGEDFYASLFADAPAAASYTPDSPTAQHPAASPDDATSEFAAVPTADDTAPFTPFTPEADTAGTPILEDRAAESPYAPESPAEAHPASAEGRTGAAHSPFAPDYDEPAPSGSPFARPADDESAPAGSPLARSADGEPAVPGSPFAPPAEATSQFAPEFSPTTASDETGVLDPVGTDDPTSIADDDTGALTPVDAAPEASAADEAGTDRQDVRQPPTADPDREPEFVEPDDRTGEITPLTEPGIDPLTAGRDDTRRWSTTDDDAGASSGDAPAAVDEFWAGQHDAHQPSASDDNARSSSPAGDPGAASGADHVAGPSAEDDEVDPVPPLADAGTVDAFTAGDDTGVIPPITDPISSAEAASPTPDDDTQAITPLGRTTLPVDADQPPSLQDAEQPNAPGAGEPTAPSAVEPPAPSAAAEEPTAFLDAPLAPSTDTDEPTSFLDVEQPESVVAAEPTSVVDAERGGPEEPTAFLDVPESASSVRAEGPTSPLDAPQSASAAETEQPTSPSDAPPRFDGDQPTAPLDALEPPAPQATSPLDDIHGASDSTAEPEPPSPMEREWVGGAWINGEWIEDAAAYLAANPHLAHPPRPARRQRRNHTLDPDHSSDAPSHQVAHQYDVEADGHDVPADDRPDATAREDLGDADVRGSAGPRDREHDVPDDVEADAAALDDDEVVAAEASGGEPDEEVVADGTEGEDVEAPTAEIAALPAEPDEDIARVDSGDSAAVGDGPRTYPPLSDQYGGTADDDFEFATDVFHDEILGSADWTADQLGESAAASAEPASVEASDEGQPEVEGEASDAPVAEDDDAGEEPAADEADEEQAGDEGADEAAAEDLTPARTVDDVESEETAEDETPAVAEPEQPAEDLNGKTPNANPALNGHHPDPAGTMLIPELTSRGTPVALPLGVEQAMRAEPERPRPKPAQTPAFEALRAWCRVRTNIVPSGFTIQVQVLDPARPSYRFDLEPAAVDDPEWPDDRLSELLGDLWIAEAQSEHGGWLFARIDAAGRTLRIDRWYDQVPEWWDTDLPSELDVEGLVRRLYRRGPDWQPSYLEQLYITAG